MKEKNFRQGLIKKYLLQNPRLTQPEIIDKLKKELEIEVDQSTISRDIRELEFELINGKYRKKDEAVIEDKKQLLEAYFKIKIPRINYRSNVQILTIKCKRGEENTIGAMLFDNYSTKVRGIFPGIGSVLVIFSAKEDAIEVRDTLRGYVGGDDSDPQEEDLGVKAEKEKVK